MSLETTAAEPPHRRQVWALLAGLGSTSALLAFFLWRQLLVARSGGAPVCGFGSETDCAALWDAAAAKAVHAWTGVPVAGWGLAWGLAAALVPLLALGRPAAAATLAGAVRVLAVGGIFAVAWLAGVSAQEEIFCAGCAATYVLVGIYAALAYLGLRGFRPASAGRGLALAAAATVVAYLLLLYPGLRTPKSAAEATREALAAAQPGAEDDDGGGAPPSAPGDPAAGRWLPPEEVLGRVLESFGPEVRQLLADALYEYRRAPQLPGRVPRSLIGPADAPVRITEFTDVLCPACAQLHANLETFGQALPEGSFSVEPRQFPLDGRCNPLIRRRDADGELRCLAAKALICLEGHPGFFKLQKQLFEAQQDLDESRLFSFTDALRPREELRRCMAGSETAAQLADDIAYARDRGITGTPLVLLNGRKAPRFGPFLYAILFTGGDAENPAFDILPPPSPGAAARPTG